MQRHVTRCSIAEIFIGLASSTMSTAQRAVENSLVYIETESEKRS